MTDHPTRLDAEDGVQPFDIHSKLVSRVESALNHEIEKVWAKYGFPIYGPPKPIVLKPMVPKESPLPYLPVLWGIPLVKPKPFMSLIVSA